ncbi:hypothetical protein NDN08_000724 [Rhodosorus marinus]|uniref:Transcription initiation factor TFIID subunit 12 domain-containing protein n=1 Tax=Rhodosorus marinus TaxID=101924 RepID=A0AAV8USU1_9RHOD|nr:hypothetical protein NDN08_000724 [Rhodosorus marinus]
MQEENGARPGGITEGHISTDAKELLPSEKLRELLSEVAPGEILDPEVEEFLQEHAIGFVESVTEFACRIAKNRESETLEAQDVQLYLEKTWNMRIPGYGDARKPVRRFAPSPAHASRMQMVNKAKMQAAANNASNK